MVVFECESDKSVCETRGGGKKKKKPFWSTSTILWLKEILQGFIDRSLFVF